MDERFRLYAERPIFVDWKATGYDVGDWYERILFANDFLESNIVQCDTIGIYKVYAYAVDRYGIKSDIQEVKIYIVNIDVDMFPDIEDLPGKPSKY